jgi:hypothetical protein
LSNDKMIEPVPGLVLWIKMFIFYKN